MRKRNLLLFIPLLLAGCNESTNSLSASNSLVNSNELINSNTITESKHQVTFKNGDETLDTIEVNHNGVASFYGEIPTKKSSNLDFNLDFIGWDKPLDNIQSDLIVNAKYQAIKDEEIEVDDYIYRPIYDDSFTQLIGYEIRYYNNFDFDGDLLLPSSYNNLPILRIGEACFMDCIIKNITIPNTVRVIDAYAFNSCENLEKLEFPDSCKVLYYAAIFCDNNLAVVNLNNIEFVGIDNFHICPKLVDISVSSKNTNFSSENHILYSKNLSTLIKVPEHLNNVKISELTTSICEEAISRLNAANEVIVPSSINSLPEKAFFESKVNKVELKGNIPVIEKQTFSHCVNLKSIVLSSGLKEIKERAFYHCESLTNIDFGDSLESIGEFAFAYCFKLQEFHIPGSLTSIGYGALDEQNAITKFVVDNNNTTFSVFDNCLYTKDFKTLLRVPQTKDSINFHANIETIGSGAFYKCQNFTEITLPETITLIEDYAFYFMNNIYHMYIPDSVTTIKEGAFQNMEILVDIHLPINLTIVDKSLFENCPLLQEVNIPYGVTEIRDSAFANCINLPVLTISKNLKSFGKDTFAACNMLDLINYEGTSSDWNKIKNRDISGLTSETEIVYNYVIN